MRRATVHDNLCFSDAFARSFQQAARAERWLEHKNGVTAARFDFDEVARGLAANLFIGGPEKDDLFAKRCCALPQCVKREERLYDAGLHVERPGAVHFAGGNAKWHFRERSGGVHRVIVAEDQELSGGARFVRLPRDAQMIAAMLLRDSLDARGMFAPLFRKDAAAAVGR